MHSDVTQEYLDSLLEKARLNAIAAKAAKIVEEEDVITVDSAVKQ